MSQQPFTAAALRGAVDLSSLKRPAGQPGAPGAPAGQPGAAGTGGAGLVVEVTDATIRDVVAASASYPVVMVLWSSRLPESADYVATVRGLVERYAGAFQLATVDVDANPGILQALQVQGVPTSFAFVAQQPVPLFEGVQPEAQVAAVLDQVLQLAAQHGVTGRVSGAAPAPQGEAEAEEPPLPPLHQKAYDAIEAGDLEAAASAYREALTENPADSDAKVGLANVGLMQRTAGADLNAARAAAAANPTDVDAQILAADLDLLGGHVEDAFLRLIDTVRATADAERNRVREHLVELFEVVGPTDERVMRARKSLMSALF